MLPINHNFNKICDIYGPFLKSKRKKLKFYFASSEKKPFKRARDGAYCPITLILSCPIKAEIREVDSQSDLTILL